MSNGNLTPNKKFNRKTYKNLGKRFYHGLTVQHIVCHILGYFYFKLCTKFVPYIFCQIQRTWTNQYLVSGIVYSGNSVMSLKSLLCTTETLKLLTLGPKGPGIPGLPCSPFGPYTGRILKALLKRLNHALCYVLPFKLCCY